MSDETNTATVEADSEKIVRVPDNPIKLLELREELQADNQKIHERIARAQDQLATNTARLAKVNERLAEFEAKGGGDMKSAAAEFVKQEESKISETLKRMQDLRSKFGF